MFLEPRSRGCVRQRAVVSTEVVAYLVRPQQAVVDHLHLMNHSKLPDFSVYEMAYGELLLRLRKWTSLLCPLHVAILQTPHLG